MDTRRSVVTVLAAPCLLATLGLAPSARAQIAGDNVNMVSGVQWPGGDPYLQRQNEPTMAVSSVNPQHVMAGANDYRSVDVPDPVYGKLVAGDSWMGVFKSLDGGQTWRSVLLPGYPQECNAIAARNATLPASAQLPLPTLCGFPATADPVMRAGTDGIFYLAGINFKRDKSASRLFVARFVDDNNKENGDAARLDPANPVRVAPTDPIRHLDTVEVWSSARAAAANPKAPPMFMDKPWIAVDVPRNASQTCSFKTASGSSILAGTVYMAWSQFYQTGVTGTDDYQSDVMISWSTDCGATWTAPMKLNTVNSNANAGVALAIEPITGRVYVSWRRGRWPADPTLAPKQLDAIMVTRSEGRKKHFAAPRAIAKIVPFDMGSGAGSARTQTMPAMAISSDGTSSWAHVAWSSRSSPSDAARIFISTAKIHPRPAGDDDDDDPEESDDETRLAWSAPALADGGAVTDDVGNVFTRGHQYMPALTFGQGRLMLFYYDTRLDHTLRLYRPIAPANGKFYEEELVRAGDLVDPNGAAAVFTSELDDYAVPVAARPHPWRHTIDVRVASLPWGASTTAGGTLVSRFPFGIRGSETSSAWLSDIGWTQDPVSLVIGPPGFGTGTKVPFLAPDPAAPGKMQIIREDQLQLNVPGFPMFKGGNVAFLGDYIDIQGPAFTPKPGGWWAFNTAPAASPVFHAVWTSNQDVRPPWDGDWTKYTPVQGVGGPTVLYDAGRAGPDQTPVPCDPANPAYVGSRDQNIYTTRVTEGLEVSSPQNVKPLAAGTPTSFVVAARNETALPMSVRIYATATAPVAFPPAASSVVDYSFTPAFAQPLTAVCATIAPHGSVTRTLFAQLKGFGLASTPLYVQVDEVTACPASGDLSAVVTTGRSGSLTLNPPVAFNALVQPDGAIAPIASGETYTVALAAPSMTNPNPIPSMTNPSMTNPEISNPGLMNPSMTNPSMTNPSMTNPSMTNPSMTNPSMTNPSMTNPSMTNPSMTNPSMTNPSMTNAAMADSLPWDLNQTVTNTGNTTASYHLKVVGSGVTSAYPLQLAIAKTYFTNAAVGCTLAQVPHDEIVVSVPDVRGSILPPTAIVDPAAADGSLANATVALAPGESATVTLRGFMKPADLAAVAGKIQVVPVAASIAPQPAVTYASHQPPPGQPPLLKAATVTTLARAGGTFTATVAKDPNSTATPPAGPTGNVMFIVNGADVAVTVPLTAGSASFTPTPQLPVGTALTALYLGDAYYAASTASYTVLAAASWSPTGSVTYGRFISTATLLPSGKVLVAGGGFTAASYASVESYDRTTGTWTQAGSLVTPRRYHTATLLQDGKVLVAGGEGFGLAFPDASFSAELYDPATATSAATGSLGLGRQSPTATLLPSGKVLVVGGYTQDVPPGISAAWWPSARAELYDPATGTWSPTGSLVDARAEHVAVLLPSGKVLVTGGLQYVPQGTGWNYSYLKTAELYDESTGTWTQTGSLVGGRDDHTATVLSSGKVLVVGGYDGHVVLATAELYDPATGTWTAAGVLGTGRYHHTATSLSSGSVLVAGGRDGANELASAELYDLATGSWAPAPSMGVARYWHTATLLSSGEVLVVGGFDNTTELYAPGP